MKKENAITLIALVITIIVLLILAGVVIVTLTSDNGVLEKVEETKQTVNVAEIEEKVKLAYEDFYLEQKTGQEYTFQEALNKVFGEEEITATKSEEVYKLSLKNQKKYIFNPETKEFIELIWEQNGKTVTNTQTGQILNVGDTVYYDSGVQEYEGTGDNQGKWGILGAENGKLLIMSKESVASITLSGKQDYLTDGKIKLNSACTPYINNEYADSARSIKIEDVDRIKSWVITETPHVYTMTSDGYVKLDDAAPSTWSKSFVNLDGKTLSIDNPIHINSTTEGAYLRIEGKAWDNLFTTANSSYWLNTPFTRCITVGAYWGFYAIISHNLSNQGNCLLCTSMGSNSSTLGVRAVVVLKSKIKISGNSTDGWTID